MTTRVAANEDVSIRSSKENQRQRDANVTFAETLLFIHETSYRYGEAAASPRQQVHCYEAFRATHLIPYEEQAVLGFMMRDSDA